MPRSFFYHIHFSSDPAAAPGGWGGGMGGRNGSEQFDQRIMLSLFNELYIQLGLEMHFIILGNCDKYKKKGTVGRNFLVLIYI